MSLRIPTSENKYLQKLSSDGLYHEALKEMNRFTFYATNPSINAWSSYVLGVIIPLISCSKAALYYVDEKVSKVLLLSGIGNSILGEFKKEVELGVDIIGQVAKEQEYLLLKRKKHQGQENSEESFHELVIPLIHQHKTQGVLEIFFQHKVTDEHLLFLREIADDLAAQLHFYLFQQAQQKKIKELTLINNALTKRTEGLQFFNELGEEAIIILDKENVIQNANDAFVKMFGYSVSEVRGEIFSEFVSDLNDDLTWFYEHYRINEPQELLCIDRKGNLLNTEAMLRYKSSDQDGFWVLNLHLVSQNKRRQDLIKASQKTLEISKNIVDAQQFDSEQIQLLMHENEEQLRVINKIVNVSNLIEENNNKLTSSIHYAQHIQDALLPTREEIEASVPEYFTLLMPKDIVSGDFYWFTHTEERPIYEEKFTKNGVEKVLTKIQNKKRVLVAADCTGHGVPGAFMSMVGHVFLNQIVKQEGIVSPDEILTKLHANIFEAFNSGNKKSRDGMDIAVCVIDKDENILEFAGAINSLYYVENGRMKEVKADKFPVGGTWKKDEERIFSKTTLSIEEPTWYYMYSDGFQDQFGGVMGKKFMRKFFKKLLLEVSTLPPKKQKEKLIREFEMWRGHTTQTDDVLVLGFKV